MQRKDRTPIGRFAILAALVVLAAAVAVGQSEKVIYSFNGSDGSSPNGLVIDAKGNLYGTNLTGGSVGAGQIYELSPNSDGSWTFSELYSFNWDINGSFPMGTLVLDGAGNLYGLTFLSGVNGTGVVFELSPQPDGSWAFKKVSDMPSGAIQQWQGSLALDRFGNLYGASAGGSTFSSGSAPLNSFGSVYRLVPNSDGTWSFQTLYAFKGANDGSYPAEQRVILDSAGSVYGSTYYGGAHDYGVVFKLMPGSGGAWSEKVLYSFAGGPEGGADANLTFDAQGNLYGETTYSVFQLVRGPNGVWTKEDLHLFSGGTSDGASPDSALTFDKAGNLYGTTTDGGFYEGTVFKLSPSSQGVWTETILHRFSPSGNDGMHPYVQGLAIDAHGKLYGTTSNGGAYNAGVVYSVTP